MNLVSDLHRQAIWQDRSPELALDIHDRKAEESIQNTGNLCERQSCLASRCFCAACSQQHNLLILSLLAI
jgi:hypothetical protein